MLYTDNNNFVFEKSQSRWSSKGMFCQALAVIIVIAICVISSGCAPVLLGGTILALDMLETMQPQISNEPERFYQNSRPIQTSVTHGVSDSQQVAPKPPVNQSEQTPDSIIDKATLAYKQLQWDEAVRLLSRFIETGNSSNSIKSEAMILLGAMEYQRGDLELAKRYFREAYRQNSMMEPSKKLFPPAMIEFYKSIR